MLIFIVKTFYIRDKSVQYVVIVVIAIGSAVMLYVGYRVYVTETLVWDVVTRGIDSAAVNIITVPSFVWYAYLSNKNRKNFAEKNVQPWILTRMKIITISSIAMAFVQVTELLRISEMIEYADPDDPISLSIFYYQAIMVIIYSICQFFAWLMPEKMKKSINLKAGYEPESSTMDNMSEADAIEALKKSTDSTDS